MVSQSVVLKKYGFTAVVFAVATTIGVIMNALTRGLKSVTKGVEIGFKTLGSKIAGILPDVIGSIVGFIFNTFFSVFLFLFFSPKSLLPEYGTKKGFIMLFTTLFK